MSPVSHPGPLAASEALAARLALVVALEDPRTAPNAARELAVLGLPGGWLVTAADAPQVIAALAAGAATRGVRPPMHAAWRWRLAARLLRRRTLPAAVLEAAADALVPSREAFAEVVRQLGPFSNAAFRVVRLLVRHPASTPALWLTLQSRTATIPLAFVEAAAEDTRLLAVPAIARRVATALASNHVAVTPPQRAALTSALVAVLEAAPLAMMLAKLGAMRRLDLAAALPPLARRVADDPAVLPALLQSPAAQVRELGIRALGTMAPAADGPEAASGDGPLPGR